MAEFNRLNSERDTKPIFHFVVVYFVLSVLFVHAAFEYSDVWIHDENDMSIGQQIQKQLALQAYSSAQGRTLKEYSPADRKKERTVVVYTGPTSLERTVGKNELYLRNFEYFLEHNGVNCSQHDTIITLSEETYDHYMQHYDSKLKELLQECEPDALRVVKRQDTCYDLGSIHLVLNQFDLTQYDYFVYLNCGVVGPLWWDVPSVSWTTFFTFLLKDRVKMSGLSANCHNRDGYQAHIQSMAFALDRTGLQIVKDSGAIYDCGMDNEAMTLADKVDLIGRYELGMTRAIFAEGYSISSWLWSRGRNSSGIRGEVHEPVVLDGPDHRCYDVWYVDPFLKISSNYPRQFPSWNMTFFKTSRFIPPDVLEEVGYELTNKHMEDLVSAYSKGLASRFWAFQMMQSVFVE